MAFMGHCYYDEAPPVCVYLDPDGKEVRCTAVFTSKETGEKEYGFSDKEYVGPVTEYVRREGLTTRNYNPCLSNVFTQP
jgi:hypothetical protein